MLWIHAAILDLCLQEARYYRTASAENGLGLRRFLRLHIRTLWTQLFSERATLPRYVYITGSFFAATYPSKHSLYGASMIETIASRWMHLTPYYDGTALHLINRTRGRKDLVESTHCSRMQSRDRWCPAESSCDKKKKPRSIYPLFDDRMRGFFHCIVPDLTSMNSARVSTKAWWASCSASTA